MTSGPLTPAQKRAISHYSGKAVLTDRDRYEVWDALCAARGVDPGSDVSEADLTSAQAAAYIETLKRMAAEERCLGPCRERGTRHVAIYHDDASLASDGLTSVPACALS